LLKTLGTIAAVAALTGTLAYWTGQQPVYAAPRAGADDSTPDAQSVAGAKVYHTKCSVCHGENRQGHPPKIPSLVGIGSRLTNQQITATIHNGKGGMPAFAKLDDPDLSALIHYLTTTK